MGILKSTLILGTGYVLGARAGRERYQQIKRQGTALVQRPQVQEAWQRARGAATDRASGAVDQVRARVGTRGGAASGGEVAGTPAGIGGLTDAELEVLTNPDTPAGPSDRTS